MGAGTFPPSTVKPARSLEASIHGDASQHLPRNTQGGKSEVIADHPDH
jgi:hypothetical protein